MIILLLLIILLLIVLLTRIKIQMFLSINNLDYYYCFNIFIYKILILKIDKKDVKIFGNKNKQKIKNNKKRKNIKSFKIIKNIKFENLFINAKVGLIEIMPTVFAVPVISTLAANICAILKIKKFNYKIIPDFNKLTFQTKMDLQISFRIIDLLIAQFL